MSGRRRVIVTGAMGFVGRRLCPLLCDSGFEVVSVSRGDDVPYAGVIPVAVGDLASFDGWDAVMKDVSFVVHLAAVTHSRDLRESAAWDRYEAVNVDATCRLARAARSAGVRHLVFMSSIKVNGDCPGAGVLAAGGYRYADEPAPLDNYGISKWQAEQALREIAGQGEMAVTVLRPPLVYGPGMKGNLRQLMRWVAHGRPLPLAGIDNRRSLVGVDNLAQAAVCALTGEPRGFHGYTLADTTLSTPELVRAIGRALGVRPRLFPFPAFLLTAAAGCLGRADQVARLTGSLTVDAGAAHTELGWQPSVTFEASMREAADWFRAERA